MIEVGQTWKYIKKSKDLGFINCTVGTQYHIVADEYGDDAFIDDDGDYVNFNIERETEFFDCFSLVNDTYDDHKDAIFQQVAHELYAVDFDNHGEFSPGSKISEAMLNYYLSLHPYNVKINKLKTVYRMGNA